MSQSSPGFVYTMVTGADMSANRYRWTKLTADYTLGIATANTDVVIGIQDDIPFAAAGVQVAVRISNTAPMEAGAAIAAGARVTPTTLGRGITATTGQLFYGIALEAATALGDVIEVLLVRGVAP